MKGGFFMKSVRARRVSADTLSSIAFSGEPTLFFAGKSDGVQVYALLAREWRDRVESVYKGTAPLRLTRGELTESALLAIVTGQVDEQWQPKGYGLLTVDDTTDGLYLVPANAYWTRIVEGGQ